MSIFRTTAWLYVFDVENSRAAKIRINNLLLMVLICAGYRAGKVFMDNEMSLFLCNACGCRRDTAQTFKRLVSDPSKGYFNNTP